MAAVRRRWARRGRPASPGRDAGPSSQAAPFAQSPAPLSLLPPLASATAAVGAPPQRHHRSSSAAHRRPRQCPNLDAKTTSALAVVAVTSCERSTEVRARRTPCIARRSCSDLAGELRRVETRSFSPRFACFLARYIRSSTGKLGGALAHVLPHRSSLATASSAAVPPCMLVGGAPAILRSIRGYRWVRLAAGSTMVLTPWPGTSPPARSARRRCPPSRSR